MTTPGWRDLSIEPFPNGLYGEMLENLVSWLKDRFFDDEPTPRPKFKKTGLPAALAQSQHNKSNDAEQEPVEFETRLSGTLESNGPGKNVFVQRTNARKDSGTQESLKILDESAAGDDESGIDPYNTGAFDRSQNWKNRNRK